MIGRAAAAAVFGLAAAATPAFATGEITCGNGNGVSVDLLVGHVDVLYVDRAIIQVGDKTWTTQPNLVPGTEISVGQAFADDAVMLVDFAIDGVDIIGRLRVFNLDENDRRAAGGVFSMKGEGAWAVDCTEPE
jgi:hypothetical protein